MRDINDFIASLNIPTEGTSAERMANAMYIAGIIDGATWIVEQCKEMEHNGDVWLSKIMVLTEGEKL